MIRITLFSVLLFVLMNNFHNISYFLSVCVWCSVDIMVSPFTSLCWAYMTFYGNLIQVFEICGKSNLVCFFGGFYTILTRIFFPFSRLKPKSIYFVWIAFLTFFENEKSLAGCLLAAFEVIRYNYCNRQENNALWNMKCEILTVINLSSSLVENFDSPSQLSF